MNSNPVLSEIQRQQAVAIAAAEDQLAAQIAAALDYQPSSPLDSCAEFVLWCQAKNVRYQPARPTTVAAYVLDRFKAGMKFDEILRHLEGIASLHDGAIGNPCATGIVGDTLSRISHGLMIEPPNSWPKEEKAAFSMLPPIIQRAIARREKDRERQLKKLYEQKAKEKRQKEAERAAAPDDETRTKGNGIERNTEAQAAA